MNIAGEAGYINMYMTPCTLAETLKLLKQQIAALYSTDDKLTTTRPKIKNTGNGECGLFAIANELIYSKKVGAYLIYYVIYVIFIIVI